MKAYVYVVMWRYMDGSGAGIVKAYNKPTQAEELRNLLEEHGSRSYSVIETELVYE